VRLQDHGGFESLGRNTTLLVDALTQRCASESALLSEMTQQYDELTSQVQALQKQLADAEMEVKSARAAEEKAKSAAKIEVVPRKVTRSRETQTERYVASTSVKDSAAAPAAPKSPPPASPLHKTGLASFTPTGWGNVKANSKACETPLNWKSDKEVRIAQVRAFLDLQMGWASCHGGCV
jgi:hypothetical protein